MFEDYPEDWTQALADAALGEGEMKAVDVDGAAIVIAAQRRAASTRSPTPACTARARWPTASSSATASSARCTAARFALADGSVEQGPAAYPQPVLETRVREGSIEVRAPQ